MEYLTQQRFRSEESWWKILDFWKHSVRIPLYLNLWKRRCFWAALRHFFEDSQAGSWKYSFSQPNRGIWSIGPPSDLLIELRCFPFWGHHFLWWFWDLSDSIKYQIAWLLIWLRISQENIQIIKCSRRSTTSSSGNWQREILGFLKRGLHRSWIYGRICWQTYEMLRSQRTQLCEWAQTHKPTAMTQWLHFWIRKRLLLPFGRRGLSFDDP